MCVRVHIPQTTGPRQQLHRSRWGQGVQTECAQEVLSTRTTRTEPQPGQRRQTGVAEATQSDTGS